ncbi:hypothetical protein BVY02_00230 [bacterium J17]|nr:hypothetical protein BVY02_00230 [bacterium J17]
MQTDRKKYWDEQYPSYWRARVDETQNSNKSSSVVKGDAKTEDDQIYQAIFSKTPFNAGKVLDVGCAWGRMFPLYKEHGLKISGADISSKMIAQAKVSYQEDPSVETIIEAEAENLPFEDDSFDNLCCLATFDATYQDRSIAEFLRVLKLGGRLYLTGKNTRYPLSDELAFQAEIGARKKGHPNFFTDIPKLLQELEEQSHAVIDRYFFPKRGDFAENKFSSKLPHEFYEWFLVIEKGSQGRSFSEFAGSHSLTFKKRTATEQTAAGS